VIQQGNYKTINVKNKRDYFGKSIATVNHISGSFVELGYASGDSARTIFSLMYDNVITRRDSWYFDSFQGFPEPHKNDLIGEGKAKKGKHSYHISLAHSLSKTVKRKINVESHVVKGFVENVLAEAYTGGPIAVLHIDLDIYMGYKTALDVLFDQVADGGIILFDEYKSDRQLKNYPGAAIAIDEFYSNRGIEQDFTKAIFHPIETGIEKFYTYK
jgi:hypothetical protein